MSYFPNTGDIFKWSVICADATQESVNSFNVFFSRTAGITVTDQITVDRLSTLAAGLWIPLIGNSARYRGSTLRRIHGGLPPVPRTKFSVLGAGPGTSGATLMANQTAGLISWYTEFGGRALRGRTYLPFPSTDDNDDPGKPSAVYQGNLGAIPTALLPNIVVISGASIATLQIGAFKEGVVAFAEYTDTIRHAEWATQIRRSQYRRKNTPPF
jgi:hypothetical protein